MGLEHTTQIEIQRLIREQKPPKPSTRISTLGDALPDVARQHGTEPLKLGKLVRGDLDWIVMKCLEKDRTRRYDTANGLALDIQRFLADEPVSATPPGFRSPFSNHCRVLPRASLSSGHQWLIP